MSRVTLGLLAHNNERHLPEALDSLVAQSFADFTLVACDDGSTDRTPQILNDYARRDARIRVVRNEKRRGYVANYAASLAAREKAAPYFAWVSDHDRYDAQWLKRLVAELDRDPNAVLSFSGTTRIDADGLDLFIPYHRFDTAGLGALERIEAMRVRGKGFGNMIYGVFRAEALVRAGGFPPCLVGDAVLLWRLALEGTFRLVDAPLFYRRFAPSADPVARQKRMAFASAPWYVSLPWPAVGAAVLLIRTGFGADGRRLARAFWDKYKNRKNDDRIQAPAAQPAQR